VSVFCELRLTHFQLLADILWSDPRDIKGRKESDRGTGVCFGPDVTKQFLEVMVACLLSLILSTVEQLGARDTLSRTCGGWIPSHA
jgi:hypothetical protein